MTGRTLGVSLFHLRRWAGSYNAAAGYARSYPDATEAELVTMARHDFANAGSAARPFCTEAFKLGLAA